MQPDIKLYHLPVLLLLTCAFTSGCQESNSAESPANTEEHTSHDDHHDESEHGHEHEHDHGHSHGPAYKPDTYGEALKEIKHRLAHMKSDLKHGHDDHVQEELVKLKEFINWLPELSGDTDMPEKEWNQVKSTSQKLLLRCEQIEQDLKSGETSDSFVTEMRKAIATLQDLEPTVVDQTANTVIRAYNPDDSE